MSSVAEWWQKETFIPQPDWAPPSASMPTRRRPRVVVAAVIAGLIGAVVVLGETSKIPAVRKSAEALAGGSQP